MGIEDGLKKEEIKRRVVSVSPFKPNCPLLNWFLIPIGGCDK
jgi:hypothetical protein